MATRARVGIQQKSGRIIASYQHWDGYPGGLGFNLIENWEDPKKVTEAIRLGDSSKWHKIIGKKIDFDDRDKTKIASEKTKRWKIRPKTGKKFKRKCDLADK